MKFQFKVTLLLMALTASSAWSRDVILLENLSTDQNGEMVISVLEKKFGIPRKLIAYKKKLKCTKTTDAIMQLCVRADGEMDIVRMNKFVVEETLGAFSDKEMI